MMVNSQRTGHRGFTIIELLVSISIIAVMVSILLPSLTSARSTTRAAQCGANLHHLHIAYSVYVTERGPMGAFGWQSSLLPYVGEASSEVYKCPEHVLEFPFDNVFAVHELTLQVYQGGTYKYDMPFEAGPWTIIISNTTPPSDIARITPSNPGDDAAIQAYASSLPNGAYEFWFEDIRPTGGDQDFNDVKIGFEEGASGDMTVTFIHESAGYVFNLATKDGHILWANMDVNGTTTFGASDDFPVELTSYGMNSRVRDFPKATENPILLLDYSQAVANIATLPRDDWDPWLLSNGVPRIARHPNWTVNVVNVRGDTQRMTIPQIDPDVLGVIEEEWSPN